jgi:hypothetical protein
MVKGCEGALERLVDAPEAVDPQVARYIRAGKRRTGSDMSGVI